MSLVLAGGAIGGIVTVAAGAVAFFLLHRWPGSARFFTPPVHVGLEHEFTLVRGNRAATLAALGGGKAKAYIVANTASACGFSGQFKALQKLHEKYGDEVVVVGVPSNSFNQEPLKSPEELENKVCDAVFKVKYPLTTENPVLGKEAHPFFQALPSRARPTWNFWKYLLNANGELVGAFPSRVHPSDLRFITALEQLLGHETQSTSSDTQS